MSESALISLNPPETLLFRLERDSNSKSILKVTNISDSKVVFKIKTTQPTWYFVRPNQQILDIGQTENVSIVLVEGECNRFLDQVALNKIEKLDKHRFLVQSTAISDDDYEKINALGLAERNDEYTRVWENSGKDEKKNLKLKVEFQYNDGRQIDEATSSAQANKINENAENLRSKLLRTNVNTTSTTASDNDNSSSLRNELEALKKKYDAVVEYTVHLTAERDTIVAQLEEVQRDLSRELTKKRSSNSSENATKSNLKSDKIDSKIEQKGFSLFTLVFIAALCFALGRYANLIQY